MKKRHILYILISFWVIISLVNSSGSLLAGEKERVKDEKIKDERIKDSIKIGVIDVQCLFEEFYGTAKAREKLKEEYDKERAELEKVEKEIEELQKSIKAAAVPEKQKEVLKKQLEDKLEDYQKMVSGAQERLERREKELTQEIMHQIYDAINRVAQEKSLDLVLDKHSILYWGGRVIDIEKEVQEKLK